MQKLLTILFCFLSGIFALQAQQVTEIELSGSQKNNSDNNSFIQVYLPEKSNGAAVIICPGGGYQGLEMVKEGSAFAPWFNKQGVAAIILKYRLPHGNHELPLLDAEKAMQTVISHAKEWNIDTKKIGIMGSSAGGHLASTLSTHFKPRYRPAFQILLYPVISMDTAITHLGSYHALLGAHPDPKMADFYSNESQVNAQTPPAFIVLGHDDSIVSPENSIRYYQALLRNKIPAELHIYPKAEHGFAFNKNFKYIDPMQNSLSIWLNDILKEI